MDWFICLLIAGTGLGLAMTRSNRAIDFVVFVFVFNRGLRRVIDYYVNHGMKPLSPISLTPLLVTGALLIPVILNIQKLPRRAAPVFYCTFLGVIYAFMVGFFRVKIAAIYALAEALAPLALFAYVLLLRPTTEVKNRWMRSFTWAALLASAYGVYQYWVIPPWDAAWLIQSKMYGYMGIPEPTKMTVFSTMAERGPLASFLAFALVPMVVNRKWRALPGLLGWAGVILVGYVIVLTMSRSGVIIAAFGCVTYVFINRGKGFKQVIAGVVVLAAAALLLRDRIPNAEQVIKRFETLQNLEEDGSLKTRIAIMSYGPTQVLRDPQGFGLGAWGLATRVNTGTMENQGTVMDAGWFNIILVYGIPGTLMLAAALVVLWRALDERFRTPQTLDEHVYLGRALFITVLIASLSGNVLMTFSLIWLAFGCGLVVSPLPRRLPMRPDSVPAPRPGQVRRPG